MDGGGSGSERAALRPLSDRADRESAGNLWGQGKSSDDDGDLGSRFSANGPAGASRDGDAAGPRRRAVGCPRGVGAVLGLTERFPNGHAAGRGPRRPVGSAARGSTGTPCGPGAAARPGGNTGRANCAGLWAVRTPCSRAGTGPVGAQQGVCCEGRPGRGGLSGGEPTVP